MLRGLIFGAVVVAAAAATAFATVSTTDYKVSVVLASATNLHEGGSVQVRGFDAGTVESITPVDGQAKIVMDLDSDHAPLHDGAVVTVRWRSLVGERHLTITDGAPGNAEIPSGGMLKGNMPQPMELDQVLAALDAPTRESLKSLVNNLDQTVGGHEQDLNKTVKTAGPALQALGEVLKGLGTDGPAISGLVSQVEQMVSTLSAHDSDVTNIIDQLSKFSSDAVGQRQALKDALAKLPGTLDAANKTLGDVPAAAAKANPLLDDLKPATEKLPQVAANLKPVLTDLRPLVAQLRPTLSAAGQLLQNTPGLLDRAHAVLPGATSLVSDLGPAVDFLRPYTPELAGLLANWSSAMANYGGVGHYARVQAEVGASSVNINPGIPVPGFGVDQKPVPGSLVNQPWTDATGGGVK
ncbi:MlaD family protein [Amycolatopsis echigonensis]|uniref:MlaD family protein n=1 Tax=Amycolatopsis echigonensis TaxID=2576905 RepID=UPI0028B0718B|nr:MlaD family protein [Amycolatopsis echigonensis]